MRVGEASGKILPSKKRKVCMHAYLVHYSVFITMIDTKAVKQAIRQ